MVRQNRSAWDPVGRSEYNLHAGLSEWVRTYWVALVVVGTLAVLLVAFFVWGVHLGTNTSR